MRKEGEGLPLYRHLVVRLRQMSNHNLVALSAGSDTPGRE